MSSKFVSVKYSEDCFRNWPMRLQVPSRRYSTGDTQICVEFERDYHEVERSEKHGKVLKC